MKSGREKKDIIKLWERNIKESREKEGEIV